MLTRRVPVEALRHVKLFCASRLPVCYPRKLLRRTVLAPGHRGVAIEDQGCVSFAFANKPLLPGAPNLAVGPVDPRMEIAYSLIEPSVHRVSRGRSLR